MKVPNTKFACTEKVFTLIIMIIKLIIIIYEFTTRKSKYCAAERSCLIACFAIVTKS